MYATLTSSEGWSEYPATSSQLRAPLTDSLVSTFSAISASASTATGVRITALRLRLRSHQPPNRNSSTLTRMSKICLYISSGVDDAATARPSAVR